MATLNLMSVNEVAAQVGLNPKTIRSHIHRGNLRALDVAAGSKRAEYRISPEAVQDFLDAISTSGPRETQPAPVC